MNLTDTEKELLKQFWENEAMRTVVRKVILQGFDVNERNDLSNEQIGEIVRASWQAKELLKMAFDEISQYETQPNKKPEINIAR